MRRIYLLFLLSGILAVMIMIFFFSAQDGPASSAVSNGITEFVLGIIDPHYGQLPPDELESVRAFTQKLVRKLAHFTEFAILGFFIRLTVGSLGYRRRTRISWCLGTLYAVTDELHQHFVAERAAMWQDVLLDSAGVLAGIVLAYTCTVLAERWRSRKAGP